MPFEFQIPVPDGHMQFSLEPGTSMYFVGPNGGGKTRLAVQIENMLRDQAHRISAHRNLSLERNVSIVREELALQSLRYGHAGPGANWGSRAGSRWRDNEATALLSDYTAVLQSLFADQTRVALQTHNDLRQANGKAIGTTKFETLVGIWDRILPHRKLIVMGDEIQASIPGDEHQYPATDLSDGERAAFYLIGQTLLAAKDTVLIIDEPELHMHRSIMARLWDEIEAARPDCAMIMITHDLEFASTRKGQKFVISKFVRHPNLIWSIEAVPENTGFSEETATLILGSRKPILFVEGQDKSLDLAVYRACYPAWTVVPRNSCEEVIHAVMTMRANAQLNRVTCGGIVDADDYSKDEQAILGAKGIAVLPVSEIENLFLLPEVAEAIALMEGHTGEALGKLLDNIYAELFGQALIAANLDAVVLRYCRRRIDRTLKKIDLSDAVSVAAISAEYTKQTAALDVAALAKQCHDAITGAAKDGDIRRLLRWYDNKGNLAIAAKLKNTDKKSFVQWIVRTLLNKQGSLLSQAIAPLLPAIAAQ